MLESLLEEYNTFIFDLDRTLWDTYSKYGNPIWAKQILFPFDAATTSTKVVDDCFSTCELHDGAQKVLRLLNGKGSYVGFLSRGAILGVPYNDQPSVKLLKHFGIYEYFNYEKLLLHRTNDKATALQKIVNEKETCVFFDDMEKDLDIAGTIKGVLPINRLTFSDWNNIL